MSSTKSNSEKTTLNETETELSSEPKTKKEIFSDEVPKTMEEIFTDEVDVKCSIVKEEIFSDKVDVKGSIIKEEIFRDEVDVKGSIIKEEIFSDEVDAKGSIIKDDGNVSELHLLIIHSVDNISRDENHQKHLESSKSAKVDLIHSVENISGDKNHQKHLESFKSAKVDLIHSVDNISGGKNHQKHLESSKSAKVDLIHSVDNISGDKNHQKHLESFKSAKVDLNKVLDPAVVELHKKSPLLRFERLPRPIVYPFKCSTCAEKFLVKKHLTMHELGHLEYDNIASVTMPTYFVYENSFQPEVKLPEVDSIRGDKERQLHQGSSKAALESYTSRGKLFNKRCKRKRLPPLPPDKYRFKCSKCPEKFELKNHLVIHELCHRTYRKITKSANSSKRQIHRKV